MIFRAREAVGQLCYSGDMFDNWTYFGPVELKEKDWYCKVCSCVITYLGLHFKNNLILIVTRTLIG